MTLHSVQHMNYDNFENGTCNLQAEVMRTQSTECLPFPMIFMGTISAFMWLLYGIILSDAFIQVSSVLTSGSFVP